MTPPSVPASPTPVLKAEDVSVNRGGLPVLRGCHVEVVTGEFVALLGPNGSGKSTLVKAVLGLLPVARGRVDLFGQPLSAFGEWRRVGYVPQRSTLTVQSASVAEVVATGRLARRLPLLPRPRGDAAKVTEALRRVGLEDRAGDAMTTLSGGQQQRVLIARALVGEPELLVMDEPLAGVDVDNQEVMAQILDGFVRAGGTVLIVLHELGVLEPLIDRAIVLQDGRLVYDGPPQTWPGFGGHEHEDPSEDGWFAGSPVDPAYPDRRGH